MHFQCASFKLLMRWPETLLLACESHDAIEEAQRAQTPGWSESKLFKFSESLCIVMQLPVRTVLFVNSLQKGRVQSKLFYFSNNF